MKVSLRVLGAAALMALVTAACNDGTGLGSPAPLSVMLQQTSNAGASPTFQIVGEKGVTALVTLRDVDSLNAQLTSVEALPQSSEADSTNDAAWMPVAVVGNGFLNLVKLPTTTQGALVVASDTHAGGAISVTATSGAQLNATVGNDNVVDAALDLVMPGAQTTTKTTNQETGKVTKTGSGYGAGGLAGGIALSYASAATSAVRTRSPPAAGRTEVAGSRPTARGGNSRLAKAMTSAGTR